MSCADSVANMLVDAHFSCCFSKVLPSALDCAEPIVVTEGVFTRDSRIAEEERGSTVVTVMVVREFAAVAVGVFMKETFHERIQIGIGDMFGHDGLLLSACCFWFVFWTYSEGGEATGIEAALVAAAAAVPVVARAALRPRRD